MLNKAKKAKIKSLIQHLKLEKKILELKQKQHKKDCFLSIEECLFCADFQAEIELILKTLINAYKEKNNCLNSFSKIRQNWKSDSFSAGFCDAGRIFKKVKNGDFMENLGVYCSGCENEIDSDLFNFYCLTISKEKCFFCCLCYNCKKAEKLFNSKKKIIK